MNQNYRHKRWVILFNALICLQVLTSFFSAYGIYKIYVVNPEVLKMVAVHICFDFMLAAIGILGCVLRWRVTFLYLLILTAISLFSFISLGGSVLNFFHFPLDGQLAMAVSILTFVIAIIGLVLWLRELKTNGS